MYPSDELLFVHNFVINVINLPEEWFVRHVDVSCEERRAPGCVSHCAGCWQLLAGRTMARMLCYPSGEASLQHLTNDWWPGSRLPVRSALACTCARTRTWPHAETERSPQLITAWHWPLHMCTHRESHFFGLHIQRSAAESVAITCISHLYFSSRPYFCSSFSLLTAGVLLSLSGSHFQGSCNGWAAQGYIQVT